MTSVAIAIMCKTPAEGTSKTRLSPPLLPKECATLSACFIRDLSQTIETLVQDGGVTGYAAYTPRGTEPALKALLPVSFRLALQSEGDFGVRLRDATADLLRAGHAGAILVNSDSPTLPRSILLAAVDAVRSGDNIVLSPALDGGYTLVGMSKLHRRVFEDIPWSTSAVYSLTLERADEIGLPVFAVPGWYDVDDATSFDMLEGELLDGRPFSNDRDLESAAAAATSRFLQARRAALRQSSGECGTALPVSASQGR